MSKYIKAQNADTNSLFDWDIAAITRSDQVGKMNDESSALRSKLFWIKLLNINLSRLEALEKDTKILVDNGFAQKLDLQRIR